MNMLHTSKTGRIHTEFKSQGNHHVAFRIVMSLLCGLAMLFLVAPVRAQIMIQDGGTNIISSTDTTSIPGSVTISTNFTATPGAQALVVILANGKSTKVPPATLAWGSQTITNIVSGSYGGAGRQVSIYYLSNPSSGANTITASVVGDNGLAMQVYTLTNIDIAQSVLTSSNYNSAAPGGVLSCANTGIASGSWAVVASLTASTAGVINITASSGTVVNAQQKSTSGAINGAYSMSYVSNILSSSDTFTATETGGSTKMMVIAAVFAPLLPPPPAPPSISQQPVNAFEVTGYSGWPASFSVTAGGNSPLSYQWFTNSVAPDNALTDNANRTGSTSNILTVPKAGANDLGNYFVVITNAYGSITSSVAALTAVASPGYYTSTNIDGSTPGTWTQNLDWQTNTASSRTGTGATQTGAKSPIAFGNNYEMVSNGVSITSGTAGPTVTFIRSPAVSPGGFSSFPTFSLTVDTDTVLMYKAYSNQVDNYPDLVLNGGVLCKSLAGGFVSYAIITGAVQVVHQSYLSSGTDGNRVSGPSTSPEAFNIAAALSGSGNLYIMNFMTNSPNIISGGANNLGYSGTFIVQYGSLLGTTPGSLGTNSSVIIDPSNTLYQTDMPGVTASVGGPGQAVFQTGYAYNTAGTLTITNGGVMDLTTNCAFTAATINGTSLSAGVHPYSELTNSYPNNFLAGGSGSITIQAYNPNAFLPATSNIVMGALSGVPQTLKIIGGKYAPTDAYNNMLLVSAVQHLSVQGGMVTTDGTNIVYTALGSFTGTDTFTYTVSDDNGGTSMATVMVNVVANGAGFNQISAQQLVGGYEVMSYAGIPGYQYALDCTTNLAPPVVWAPVVTNVAATNGFLSFSNPPSGAPQDFYRTRYVP